LPLGRLGFGGGAEFDHASRRARARPGRKSRVISCGDPWEIDLDHGTMTNKSPRPTALRQYVKLCERADFEDVAFQAMLREIFPGIPQTEKVHRKYWELAMLGLYLQEVGALRADAEALSVGAGQEPILFWMANRVARMVATDIYGQGAFGQREADAVMLSNPAVHAPYPYREAHLEVHDMNALHLEFPDASFDIVFSLSSIEHFGGPQAAATAVREMSRVLRPDGHLLITTECLVGDQLAIRLAVLGRRLLRATLRRRGTEVFSPRELERDIVDASGLELAQPLDTHVSAESFENLVRFTLGGGIQTPTGNVCPHIVLRAYGVPWTSVFLALRKPT
jgi:SAM-dependent methyltransferase